MVNYTGVQHYFAVQINYEFNENTSGNMLRNKCVNDNGLLIMYDGLVYEFSLGLERFSIFIRTHLTPTCFSGEHKLLWHAVVSFYVASLKFYASGLLIASDFLAIPSGLLSIW